MSNQVINIGAAPLVLNGQPLGGGFSFAYDLGGSTIDYANQAYNFLDSQNKQDQAFLSGSIAGTQDFLAHQSTPLVDTLKGLLTGVGNLMQSNQTAALSLTPITTAPSFSVQGMIDAFGNQVASQQVTLADLTSQSINQIGANTASSNYASTQVASSGGGGLCFISTAICRAEHLPDDCHELSILRKFRDDYVLLSTEGQNLVRRYYSIAPGIVGRIDARSDSSEIYFILRWHFIDPILSFIENLYYGKATAHYIEMVNLCERL
jgi:hypothetical protein